MKRVVLVLLVAAGCRGSGPTDGSDPPLACPAVAEARCQRIASVRVVGVDAVGTGAEVTILVRGPDGPIDEDVSHCLAAVRAGQCGPFFGVERVDAAVGATAVLVSPGAAVDEWFEATIATRRSDARVATYHWGEAVVQLSSFTKDVAALRRGLRRRSDAASRTAFVNAVEAVDRDLAALPREHGVLRAIVADDPDVTSVRAAAIVVRGFEQAETWAARGVYRARFCGDDPVEAVQVWGTRKRDGISHPAGLAEERRLGCTFVRPDPPQRIGLIFTSAERAVHDDLVAQERHDEFSLSVRLGDLDTSPAVAHLRGKSSASCERKSYSINLEGKTRRRLFDDHATDEFLLVAMCKDDRYLNQITANRLMASLGVFPFRFRTVELTIDGVSAGIYLLVEKPKEHFTDRHPRLRSLIRRRLDIGGFRPELRYPRDGAADALRVYQELTRVADTRSGSDLVSALQERMDLDQYLRWIALMTLLENGDFIDEVWFASTETNADGAATDYFGIAGWDADDLFSPCHARGENAIADAFDLYYCVESLFDHAVLNDPAVYALYVDILESVLDRIDSTTFDAALTTTATDVLTWLAQGDIRGAMVELLSANPGAIDLAEAERDIHAKASWMSSRFNARRILLRQRIADYRSANGR